MKSSIWWCKYLFMKHRFGDSITVVNQLSRQVRKHGRIETPE